jgi:hypothetical protein
MAYPDITDGGDTMRSRTPIVFPKKNWAPIAFPKKNWAPIVFPKKDWTPDTSGRLTPRDIPSFQARPQVRLYSTASQRDSEEWAILPSGKKIAPHGKGIIYHGWNDRDHLRSVIEGKGLPAIGTNWNIQEHTEAKNPSNTAFRSGTPMLASPEPDLAQGAVYWAGEGGLVYAIETPYWDANQA